MNFARRFSYGSRVFWNTIFYYVDTILYYPLIVIGFVAKVFYKISFLGTLIFLPLIGWRSSAPNKPFGDYIVSIGRSSLSSIGILIVSALTVWFFSYILFRVIILNLLGFLSRRRESRSASIKYSSRLIRSASSSELEKMIDEFKHSSVYADPMVHYGDRGFLID